MDASKNIYSIPFSGGLNIRAAPFHFESDYMRNAVDFALDIGTPILASCDGLVDKIVDNNGEGGFDRKFLDKTNLVILKHPCGEYSLYVHMKAGILVKEGQGVEAGEPIGYSGMSGYTSYPHLHYQTSIKNSKGKLTSIPTRFKLGDGIRILVSPRE